MNELPDPVLELLIVGEFVAAVQLLKGFRRELVVWIALSDSLETRHLPGIVKQSSEMCKLDKPNVGAVFL